MKLQFVCYQAGISEETFIILVLCLVGLCTLAMLIAYCTMKYRLNQAQRIHDQMQMDE